MERPAARHGAGGGRMCGRGWRTGGRTGGEDREGAGGRQKPWIASSWPLAGPGAASREIAGPGTTSTDTALVSKPVRQSTRSPDRLDAHCAGGAACVDVGRALTTAEGPSVAPGSLARRGRLEAERVGVR